MTPAVKQVNSNPLLKLKKKINSEAESQVKILDSIKQSEVLEELMLLHNQGLEVVEPSDYSGIVKGRNNIYNHMETMIKSAKNSVTINTTTEGLIRKHDSLFRAIKKAKGRGVNIVISAPTNKSNEKHKKNLESVSLVKNTKNKSRFCLIDGKEIMFMLMDDKDVHPNFDVGVWVNAPVFVSDIETLYYSK